MNSSHINKSIILGVHMKTTSDYSADVAFEDEIKSLIQKKYEGTYWDFKRQWHDKSNPSSLLYDIICFANNTAWHDAYIIIGVDEQHDYQLVDVANDINRRNTCDLVNFLRDKPFAAQVRPEVEVRTLSINAVFLDVIVIRATRNTPYYLIKDSDKVFADHIYSRVMDANTDRNKSADPWIVEKLWANRFALNAPAFDRALRLLQSPQDWLLEPGDDPGYYHSVFPEFTIHYEYDETRNGMEYYLFSQINSTPHWYDLKLMCHQTTLFSCICASLDSGAFMAPCPESEWLLPDSERLRFDCYTKGTIRYILYEFFRAADDSPRNSEIPRMKYLECVPVFESEQEKRDFLVFAESNASSYLGKEYLLPYFEKDEEQYADPYYTALVVNDMLRDFRAEFYRIE